MNCSRFFIAFVCACLAVSGICSAHDHEVNHQPLNTRINQQAIKDLELFSSHANAPGVIRSLNHTTTKQGYATLKELMSTLISDSTTLKKRQSYILYLHEHPELLNELQTNLSIIGDNEHALHNLQATHDAVKQTALNEFYIPHRYFAALNNSPVALDLWQWAHGLLLAMPTLEHLALHYLLTEKAKQVLNVSCGHDHSHNHGHHHHDCHHTPSTLGSIALYTFHAVHMPLHFVALASLVNQVKGKLAILKEVQADLITTKQVLDAASHIEDLLKKHPIMLDFFREQGFFLPEDRTPLSTLYTLLSQNTFSGEASLCSRPGNILAAYKAVRNARPAIKKLCSDLAQIDAYTSLAQAYHVSQHHEHRFTCATYIERTEKPSITLHHAWHPLIAQDAIVPHSVQLGYAHKPHAMIITGQNMSGKSTTLKMTALSIVMAQTCGFVPAHAMELTPFSDVCTSLSLTDNISAGISSFAAELASADAIVTTLNAAKGFVFVAIDELFIGTNPQKGEKTLEDFMRTLATYNTLCCMLSTHFVGLATLAHEFPDVFSHYVTQARNTTLAKRSYLLSEQHS